MLGFLDGLFPIFRVSANNKIGFAIKEFAQASSDSQTVVDDQYGIRYASLLPLAECWPLLSVATDGYGKGLLQPYAFYQRRKYTNDCRLAYIRRVCARMEQLPASALFGTPTLKKE
jgi:hypothetical protein